MTPKHAMVLFCQNGVELVYIFVHFSTMPWKNLSKPNAVHTLAFQEIVDKTHVGNDLADGQRLYVVFSYLEKDGLESRHSSGLEGVVELL